MNEVLSTDAVDSVHEFANQIVGGLQHSISRATAILDVLYDVTVHAPDTGEVRHPHRTLALAEGYTKVAKVYGSTLDGVISAAQRRQMDQRLAAIEKAQANPNKRHDAVAAFDPQTVTGTSNVHPFTPRRSLADMLDILPPEAPQEAQGEAVDPFSPTPTHPDPFEGF